MGSNLGSFLNKITYRFSNFFLFQTIKSSTKKYHKEYGLKVNYSSIKKHVLKKEKMVYTISSNIFPRPLKPKPANVRYMSPVLNDPDWTSSWSNPCTEEDIRPLVVISLSSTFRNQQATIQSAIDALRNQEIRGLVTLGPALN